MNKYYIYRLRKIFFSILLFSGTSLLLSQYWALASIGYFINLLLVIIIIIQSIRHNENKAIVIAQILATVVLVTAPPFVLAELPYEYNFYHTAFSQYIIDNGHIGIPYITQLPQSGYGSWFGSHTLIASIVLITKFDIVIIYHLVCIVEGLLIVLFFYLFIYKVVNYWKMAAFSALVYGLFCTSVLNMVHAVQMDIARCEFLMAWLALMCAGKSNRYAYFVIAILGFTVAVVSHHLDPAIFTILLLSFSLSKYFRNFFSISIDNKWIIVLLIGLSSWWLYVASQTSIRGLLIYFFNQLQSTLHSSLSLTFSWPSYSSAGLFDPGFFISTRIIYYILFLLISLVGVVWILLASRQKIGDSLAHLSLFVVPWCTTIFAIMAILFIAPIGGTTLPAFRFLSFLAFPLAASIGFILTKVDVTSLARLKYHYIYSIRGIIICVVFLGILVSFPIALYLGKIDPRENGADLKAMAIWSGTHTSDNAHFFGDNRTSQAIVTWAKRQGEWGDTIGFYFEIDKIEVLKGMKADYGYIALNTLNTVYGVYVKWGEYYNIPSTSVFQKINNELKQIYTNGTNNIYLFVES